MPNVVPALKNAASNALPYVGLLGVGGGASLLVSSLAGAGVGAVLAGCFVAPTVMLIGEFMILGGGQRVAKLMGGQPADAHLTGIVHEVARKANMRPPAAVFEVPTEEPNAFAAGFSERDTSVAVTTGLRRALTTSELKAVIAHEMGHIQARDVNRNMHLAAVFAGLGGAYEAGRMLLKSKPGKKKKSEDKDSSVAVGMALMAGGLFAKVGGEMLRCGQSRRAEFRADLMGAKLYGADAMASALRKIDALTAGSRASRDRLGARGNAFAHAYISNPGSRHAAAVGASREGDSWWSRLSRVFDTHPTLEQRVESIRQASV